MEDPNEVKAEGAGEATSRNIAASAASISSFVFVLVSCCVTLNLPSSLLPPSEERNNGPIVD